MDSIARAAEGGSDELHPDSSDEWQGLTLPCSVDISAVIHLAGEVQARAQAEQPRLQPQSDAGQGVPGGPPPNSFVAPALPPAAGGLGPPPGFGGRIAQFIYASAPRPMAEAATVAALGLLAGVCGRQWYVSGSGLNIYVVLVARSATGKEAMHQGVSKLLSAARKRYSLGDDFVNFDDFASGPALIKALVDQDCFVNIVGEIGHKFSAMAKGTDPAALSLRRQMTNLYTKSGPHGMAGGIAYSNRENNAKITGSVAYSLIGETTPARFYESITSDMMSDGFLSRFTVVEYEGDRPDKNPWPLLEPDDGLTLHLVSLMQQANQLRQADLFHAIQFEGQAKALLDELEGEADRRIRAAGEDEPQRQMWNRAHLKALRVAGLLAVADNHINPMIRVEHAQWAIELTRRDIQIFSKRLQSGDIGDGTDDGRERKLLGLCRDYLVMEAADVPGYARPFEELRKHGLVARKYLQQKTQRIAAFEKHRLGHKAALDSAIQVAIDNGHLRPAPKEKLVEDFNFHGKVYAVLNAEEFRTITARGDWFQAVMDAVAAQTKK